MDEISELLDELDTVLPENLSNEQIEEYWKAVGAVVVSEGTQKYVEEDYSPRDGETLLRLLEENLLQKRSKKDFCTKWWESLAQHDNIPIKLLPLSLLDLIVRKSSALSFPAARLYMVLLQLPNAPTYQLFHPAIFRSIFNLLRSWKNQAHTDAGKEMIKGKRGKRKGSKDTSKSKKGKASKSKQKVTEPDMDEEDSGIDEPASTQATQSEVTPQNQSVNEMSDVTFDMVEPVFEELHSFYTSIASDNQPAELKSYIIEVLIDYTRLPNLVAPTTSKKSKKNNSNVMSVFYRIMLKLLQPIHGAPELTAVEILKNLLPNMLMTFLGTGSGTTIPKSLTFAKQEAIHFVQEMVKLDNEKLYDPLHAFIQHICTSVPDRAEFRNHAMDSIKAVLEIFPPVQQARFLRFLQRYSKNAKAGLRVFAVELASMILCNLEKYLDAGKIELEPQPTTEEVAASEDGTSENVDESLETSSELTTNTSNPEESESSTTRSSSQPQSVAGPLLDILIQRCSDKIASVRARALACLGEILEESLKSPLLKEEMKEVLSGNGADAALKGDMLQLLRRRVNDDKAGVRKSTLQVFETLGNFTTLEEQDIVAILEKCTDPAVSIRKQAVTCLSNFIQTDPQNKHACVAWIRGVLPSVSDPESSMQERLLDHFEQLIMNEISNGNTKETSPTWVLLNALEGDSIKYLQRVCSMLSRQKRFAKKLVTALQRAVAKKSLSKGAWMLLSEIAPYCSTFFDMDLIVEYFHKMKGQLDADTLHEYQKLLSILECVAPHFSNELAASIANELYNRLKTFRISPALIQAFIRTLDSLSRASGNKEFVTHCFEEILAVCDRELASFVLPKPNETPAPRDPEEIIRYLFTLGELAQICSSSVPSRLITVVQALISPVGNVVAVPTSVRAFAFIALGKLCLEDIFLAKKCIPAFARELETSNYPAIRNNVLIIMSDLCIKYTSVVDNYIPNLAMCLRDSNELVRRQTLMLLSRLLQEDFVKWKGPLFYRFVIALSDEAPDIRQSAKFCFVTLLKTKNPLLFFTHFMETVFYLNNYKQHPVYNQFPQSDRERATFAISGPEQRKKRMSIYRVFLSNMTEEQKFQITAKLCQEVLGGILEGLLPFDSCTELLCDSLAILSCKEIKLSSRQTKETTEDEPTEEQQALQNAKEKILSKIVKKNVLENIVPIIIELKRLLEKHRSPLLKNLMEYLKELMKDFKDEVNDILVADKQLAKEIQYDLRQLTAQPKPVPPPAVLLSPTKGSRVASAVVAASPRPELSNFSVPRVRANAGSVPSTPKSVVSKATTEGGSPTDLNIDLQSPKSASRQWAVDLTGVSKLKPTQLNFDDIPADENTENPVPKRSKTTTKAKKKKATEDDTEAQEEEEIALTKKKTKSKRTKKSKAN